MIGIGNHFQNLERGGRKISNTYSRHLFTKLTFLSSAIYNSQSEIKYSSDWIGEKVLEEGFLKFLQNAIPSNSTAAHFFPLIKKKIVHFCVFFYSKVYGHAVSISGIKFKRGR